MVAKNGHFSFFAETENKAFEKNFTFFFLTVQ